MAARFVAARFVYLVFYNFLQRRVLSEIILDTSDGDVVVSNMEAR